MGIINLTPDSFSRDGLLKQKKNTVMRRALQMVRDGADILDVGGESTRPGARRVSAKSERERVIPIIETLCKQVKVPVSVDTYKPEVAQAALDAGASIVNNIMGSRPERALLKMVKDYKAAIVLMHIKGTPRTMQQRVVYRDVTAEITAQLRKSIEICLECGIKSDRIIIDPGIGFGKSVEHNLEILRRLEKFRSLDQPILIGTSRKSFIGNVLGRDVSQRLMGSAASVCYAITKGAHIVRVHDVEEMADVARLSDAMITGKRNPS